VTDEEAPRCRSCGRQLRDERSRRLGVGPVCARALRAHTEPRVFIPAPTVTYDSIPGQTELPLAYHQPTLESL
jgi:hypothetical protein